MFFEVFKDRLEQPLRTQGYEWETYAGSTSSVDSVLVLGPNVKKVVGDPSWSDFVLEAVVMLHQGQGNAGLIFRVNAPGPGADRMHGYYVGFDTDALYLGKMNNNWQQLERFDLSVLDCKVVTGVWNHIRIAAIGAQIKVWFNKMHPSADEDHGLRIDFTDNRKPILSGKIGVRTHKLTAWFDNLVLMPASVCSKDILGQ